jgi:catechol 2,3-dioxygenase-like lactoylglutathione lyase family enzyme
MSDSISDVAALSKLGRVIPILSVSNLEASVAYYVQRLGFQQDWTGGGVASVSRDRATLMLCQGDQGQPGTWLWIPVSEVDALYSEFEARGAQLRHPPTNYPWGSRECQVTDLDGHVLRFGDENRPGEPMGPWRDGKGRLWLVESDGSWRLAE